MSSIFFAIATVMLAYDCAGHALAALARWFAGNGSERAAYLWNTYSTLVWPRISSQLHYDIYWTAWHGVTLLLFFIARFAP